MKLKIDKKILAPVVTRIIKGVSKHSTIPILQGFKLELTKDGLLFTSSNGEVTIQELIPQKDDGKELYTTDGELEEAVIFYPAKLFHDLLKKMRGTELEICIDEGSHAKIISGRTESTIGILDASEYPKNPKILKKESFDIGVDVLKGLISKTAYASATGEARPILKGIHITLEEGKLSFVSTDSHRLSKKTIMMGEEKKPQSITVPATILRELASILEGDVVSLSFTDRQMVAKFNNNSFVSKTLEGTYPDIDRIIPNQFRTMLTFNTKELLQAIECCTVLADDQKHIITIKHEEGNQCVSFTSKQKDGKNKIVEEIFAGDIKGEGIEMSFNASFLLDILKSVTDNEIGFAFEGTMKPFLLKPIENQDETYLILPVRAR